jgi:hypothetical protein
MRLTTRPVGGHRDAPQARVAIPRLKPACAPHLLSWGLCDLSVARNPLPPLMGVLPRLLVTLIGPLKTRIDTEPIGDSRSSTAQRPRRSLFSSLSV